MPQDPWDDDRGDDLPDETSDAGPTGGVPDDLSDLTPDDIPDDLSDLLGPAPSEDRTDPSGHPSSRWRAADGSGRPDDPAAAAADGPVGDQRSTSARWRERYIEVRAATMTRDGGPGLVLRWAARAPLVTTMVLAVVVGAVLAVTFGVPPVSPLFLIPVVCGPVYPWLRLESRAQAAWRSQQSD